MVLQRAIVPGTLTALVVVLGAIRLGRASLWLDEATSRALARAQWNAFVDVASAKEANMSLYYAALRAWRAAFGDSETALRSLSVLAAAAAIPLLWLLAVKLFDRTVATIACALLAVNAFVLHHAHQTRGYTLVMTLVIASTLLFVRAVEHSSVARWAAYAVVAAASVYTHFFAGLLIPVHALALIAVRTRIRWRDVLAGAAILAVLLSPLALFMQSQEGAQVAWIPKTTLRTVAPTFEALTGLGGKPLLVAYFIACAAGVVTLFAGARAARWKWLLMFAWAGMPAAIAFGVSLAVPIVRPQYLIVIVPALALLAASALTALSRWPRAAAAAALAGLAVAAMPSMYRGLQTHDWRSAARWMISSSRQSDAAVFYAYYGVVPFSYYAQRLHGPLYDAEFPPAVWDSRDIVRSQPLAPRLDRVLSHTRIWLVLNNARTDRPTAELAVLLNELGRSYRRTMYREFQGGIRIGLYERTGFTPSDGALA